MSCRIFDYEKKDLFKLWRSCQGVNSSTGYCVCLIVLVLFRTPSAHLTEGHPHLDQDLGDLLLKSHVKEEEWHARPITSRCV